MRRIGADVRTLGQPQTLPEARKAIGDATRAIELDPNYHMAYAHRAVADTPPADP